jgi:glutathione S-transferase
MEMKLYYAPPSPFARKVRVLARELGLQDRVQEVVVNTTPVAPAPEVTTANPLSKIPTLVLADGTSLYDSRVIAEYLLTLAGKGGGTDWSVLRRQALADGVLDAGLAHRYETVLRPKELHWPEWLAAQMGKVRSGIAALASDLPEPAPRLDAIATACTLGWLEFRMPEFAWRDDHPELAHFQHEMSQRASMVDTHPSH